MQKKKKFKLKDCKIVVNAANEGTQARIDADNCFK